MAKLRIAIIGCTKSTERCVEELMRQGQDDLVGIITLDEKKAATKSRYVSLEAMSKRRGIPLFPVEKTNDPAVVKLLKDLAPDYLLEIGWSHWIGTEILSVPRLGAIGIHNSVLPKNQGAASLNWALIRDEKSWGVTLFSLKEEIDAGEIIAQKEFAIDDGDDVNSLFDKADECAVAILRESMPVLRQGKVPRTPQDPAEATKLPRRCPADGEINWNRPAREIWNLIRALKKPYPPAFTFLSGRQVLVCDALLSATPSSAPGVVHSVANGAMIVGAAYQSVALLRLQADKEEELTASAFADRHGIHPGHRFGR